MTTRVLYQLLLICTVVTGLAIVGESFIPSQTDRAPLTQPNPTVNPTTSQESTISLSIGEKFASSSFTITATSTALSVLRRVDALDTSLALATETYPGMGELVTSMYGVENGTAGQYWHYTVNGELASISADAFQLASGDVLRWEHTTPQY